MENPAYIDPQRARAEITGSPNWALKRIDPPDGEDALELLYGPSGTQLCRDAVLTLPAPVGATFDVQVHPLAAPTFIRFLRRIWGNGGVPGYATGPNGLWRCIKSIRGYEQDTQPGSFPTRTALTSYGACLTINEGSNRALDVTPTGMPEHTLPEEEPGSVFWAYHPIVMIAKELGITWGGHLYQPCGAQFMFGRNDPEGER